METNQAEEDVNAIPEGKLFCFLTPERLCGADCMAYLTTPPNTPDHVGQQWPRCLLLVNAERAGKHLVILASTGKELIAAKRAEERAKKAPGVL